MRVAVTFRNTEGETWFKEYIDERLGRLKKYIDHPVEAHVVLSVEKFRNVAEINLTSNGMNINAKEEAKEMHLAIDNAVDKIERQLKKHKEKIRTHKGNARAEDMEPVEPLSEEADYSAESKLVETRKVVLKPMSLDDAVLEMESSKNRFVIYRDSFTEGINVIYRRDDGNYVLIQTNS